MKKNDSQTRQGDLLIQTTDAIPEGLKLRPTREGRYVAAYGEVTGHAHTMNLPIYEDENGTMYFKVDEGEKATLLHEEHDQQTFGPGLYTITPQREFDPARDGERRVID